MTTEKICFVIMPISNNPNYSEGHFNRVFEHLIVPACEEANFKAIRADLVTNTNHIVLDVITKIIESEMVLCDLSSQNPNVLYELGIRQAFNKPVTLIKDSKTNRIFDIQGFRDTEYDESLRIDKVQDDIEKISQMLLSTYEEREKDINSLISLLNITPAKIEQQTKITDDTKLILNSISSLRKRLDSLESEPPQKERTTFHYPRIPSNVGDTLSPEEVIELHQGQTVYHTRFGFGKIVKINKKDSIDASVTINFNNLEEKNLLIRFAKLRKVLVESP